MEIWIMNIATIAVEAFRWLMIIYILMSWIPSLREGTIGKIIENIVDPYLSIFRKIIPSLGGIDFSPILAFFAYSFITSAALNGLAFILSLIF